MIIAVLLIVFAAACWSLRVSIKRYDTGRYFVFGMLGVIFSSIGLLVWPLNYYCTVGNIQYFNAVKETTEEGRAGEHVLEGVTFRIEIAEWNGWLRRQQYWNDTIWDPFIPDEVDARCGQSRGPRRQRPQHVVVAGGLCL